MKFIQERPDEKLSPGHHLFLYMFDEDRPANAFDQAKRSQVRRFAKSRLPLTLHDTIKVRSSEEVHQDTLGGIEAGYEINNRRHYDARFGLSNPAVQIGTMSFQKLTQTELLLLDYFLQTRNTDVFPIQCLSRHHEEWILTQATLEPACLLGLISYSAALLDSEKGPGNQNMIGPRTASYWHVAFKVKAIRYLSEKVSNPEDALSITTIYGVACVLAIEMLNGDKEAIATNLQGLKTIVSIRGGFQGIPAAIMDLIIRAWHMSATVVDLSNPVEFPPWEGEVLTKNEAAISFKQAGIGFHRLFINKCIGQTLLSAIDNLRLLSQFQKSHHRRTEGKLSDQEAEAFCMGYYSTQASLLSLLPQSLHGSNNTLEQMVALALLIYSYIGTFKRDPAALLLRTLASRLRSLVQKVYRYSAGYDDLEALLWVSFQGADICEGQPDEAFYLAYISSILVEMKLSDWSQVNTSLNRYFVTPLQGRQSFKNIWEKSFVI